METQLQTHDKGNRIKLKDVITIIIILYMLHSFQNLTTIYYQISKKQLAEVFGWQYADWFQSLFVVAVLDLSVIIWVRIDRYLEANIFAILILLLNLIYYEWPGIFEKETNRRIAEFIFSGMVCFGITRFSYISAKMKKGKIEKKKQDEGNELKIIQLEARLNEKELENNQVIAERNRLQSKVSELEASLNQLIQNLNQAKKMEEELDSLRKKEELERTCEYCQKIQESIDSKRVHKGQCAENPKNKEKQKNTEREKQI